MIGTILALVYFSAGATAARIAQEDASRLSDAQEVVQETRRRIDPQGSIPRTASSLASVVITREYNGMPVGTSLFRHPSGLWLGATQQDVTDADVDVALHNGYAIARQIEGGVNLREANAAIDALARGTRVSLQQAMRDINQILQNSGDWVNLRGSWAAAAVQTTAIRTSTKKTTNPAAAPAPAPAKSTTPKSAIDRLLEDDLISDDDPGVNPKA